MGRPLPPPSPAGPPDWPDLTAGILARTSGAACGRLRDLACDFADGLLGPDDADLVRGHLEHCPRCQGLVSSLKGVAEPLRSLAFLDPGPGFTTAVLAVTSRSPSLRPHAPDRLLEAWGRLLRRPRAALELAYLATAAGLVITQLPLPNLQGPSGPALVRVVRARALRPAAHALGHLPSSARREFARLRPLGPPEGPSLGRSDGPAFWARLWRHVADTFQAEWRRIQALLSPARPAPRPLPHPLPSAPDQAPTEPFPTPPVLSREPLRPTPNPGNHPQAPPRRSP